MKHPLLKSWAKFKPNNPPYLLKGDEALETNIKAKTFTSYNSFIKDHRPADTKTIHLGLIPVPYAGDLAKAKIFILLLNPGFKPINYFTEYNHKPYRQALLNNLKQKNLDSKYPFLSLNPRFLWASSYWSQKFGKIIHEIMDKKGWSYTKTLSHLSKNIAIIQYFPYHSSRYALTVKEAKALASPKLACAYVQEYLKSKAEEEKILILVTRKSKIWGLKPGKNIKVFKGPESRAAHLGRYKRVIIQKLGI